MPADISIPYGLRMVLGRFRPHFSGPGFEVFTALLVGHILAPVGRTVCGMLTAAGLAGVWHHARAHRFFANTRWDVRQVGLTMATLIVQTLMHEQAPVLVAVDETLMRRRGPRVQADLGSSQRRRSRRTVASQSRQPERSRAAATCRASIVAPGSSTRLRRSQAHSQPAVACWNRAIQHASTPPVEEPRGRRR